MNPTRRKILASTPLLLAGAAMARSALAQNPIPKQDKEYRLVSPQQPVESKTRVEVIEFFSYACPHCYAFEPIIAPWVAKLPPVVMFRRVPVTFFENWVPVARLYYALEVLGETSRMHRVVFDAIHQHRQRLNTDAAVVEFMEKSGVARQKFVDAYNSFTVQSNMARVQQLLAAYNVDAVPEIAVDGRYMTSNTMVGGKHEDVLPVVDYLIAESRKLRKI